MARNRMGPTADDARCGQSRPFLVRGKLFPTPPSAMLSVRSAAQRLFSFISCLLPRRGEA
ncbi:hypothetical protein ColTof3_02670 [Colletotrichum tofieldiae]|nr:hypothetical protein ColTof3_02670 [Colletotrichum tofieldiae]